MPAPPPLESAAQATVVFVGTVVAELPRTKQDGMVQRHFEFAVEEILAGTGKDPLTVSTGLDSAACGFHFVVGEKYLVYAYGEVTALMTNICTRTAHLDRPRATEDLEILRKAKHSKTAPPKK